MRQWSGIRDDTAAVGNDGMELMTNVSLYINGEVRERPGLSQRMDAGGIGIAELYDRVDGTTAIHVESDGTIDATTPGSAGSTELDTGYDTTVRPTLARSNGRVYIVNDFNPMKVVRNATDSVIDAGMTVAPQIGTPSQANGSNTTVGDHLVRFRWYDSRTGYYSSAGSSITVTVGASTEQLTFTIGSGGDIDTDSAPAQADQAIVQMTLVDGTAYYDAAFAPLTDSSVVIDISDTTLADSTITGTDAGNESDPPPLFRYVLDHKGYLFGFGSQTYRATGLSVTNGSPTVTGSGLSTKWAGRTFRVAGSTREYSISASASGSITLSEDYQGSTDTVSADIYVSTPGRLRWSQPGLPEQWKSTDARDVFTDDGGDPTGMASFYGVLYLFSRTQTVSLSYSDNPATGQLDDLPTDMGAWNQRCLIGVDGKLFGAGPNGIWQMIGTQPQHISAPIDPTMRNSWDATAADKFFMFHEPRERCIYFMYVASGDTEPRNAVVYDYRNRRWLTATFEQAKQSATEMRDENGNNKACLGDVNGYSWMLTEGVFDGVQNGFTGSLIASSGSTTTVVNVDQVLQTSHPDLKGVTAYHVSSGESRLISSNTANAFTVSSAFSTAPADGDIIYIGRVPVTIQPKWMAGDGQMESEWRPGKMQVSFVTQADGAVNIRQYKDWETNGLPCTRNASDAFAEGLFITHGLADATVNLTDTDGVVPVPVFANYARVHRWRLTKDEPAGRLRLLDVAFNPEQLQDGRQE